jgi:hypothetical protein
MYNMSCHSILACDSLSNVNTYQLYEPRIRITIYINFFAHGGFYLLCYQQNNTLKVYVDNNLDSLSECPCPWAVKFQPKLVVPTTNEYVLANDTRKTVGIEK